MGRVADREQRDHGAIVRQAIQRAGADHGDAMQQRRRKTDVGGAVVGAMIMGVMNNGMSILGIGIDYQQVIKGLVLLGAVCLDVYNQRR